MYKKKLLCYNKIKFVREKGTKEMEGITKAICNQKGITLLSLVITVVILLILAVAVTAGFNAQRFNR